METGYLIKMMWKIYQPKIGKRSEITMNLCDFFEYMDPETDVIVEWNGEKIFSSKVCNISEDETVMYWIKSESIVLKDGVMLIPVEH